MMTLAYNTQVLCLIYQESTTLVYDDASLQYTGDVSDTPRIYYTGLCAIVAMCVICHDHRLWADYAHLQFSFYT